MEILSVFWGAILAHTEEPYDLFIFDNGGFEVVGDYLERLRRAGSIQHILRLKENIGKIDAFYILFMTAPGGLILTPDEIINWGM